MKTGWQTTEFWTALGVQVLSLLSVLGIINVADQEVLKNAVGLAIGGAAMFIANAWVVVRYVQGRTALKSQEASAQERAKSSSSMSSEFTRGT